MAATGPNTAYVLECAPCRRGSAVARLKTTLVCTRAFSRATKDTGNQQDTTGIQPSLRQAFSLLAPIPKVLWASAPVGEDTSWLVGTPCPLMLGGRTTPKGGTAGRHGTARRERQAKSYQRFGNWVFIPISKSFLLVFLSLYYS